MEEMYSQPELSWGQKNKLLIIGSVAIVFILLIVTTFLVVSRSRQSANILPQSTNPGANSTSNSVAVTPFVPQKIYPNPKIQVKSWVDPAKPQNIPISGNVYSFKQNFSTAEVKELASKLATNQTFREENNKILSYTVNKSKNNISIMTFDKTSGAVSYSSTMGLPLNDKKDLSGQVYELLSSLNLYDPTIQISATYKQKDNPNLTYVELHRDWQKTGIPILNLPGLLNLPEQQSLSSLSLQTPLANLVPNSNIYNTSDHKDGLARQADFNTMTLIVYEAKNTLYSLRSNIRPLQKQTPDVVSLTNYDQLLSNLKSGKYNFFMASPAGDGAITWDKIFPNNQASANQATITEATYAYVESPAAMVQTKLEPYIIFRGYSTLDNGYRVNWIASVSATEQKSLTQKLFNFIKPVEAQASNSCEVITAPSNIPQDDVCPAPNQVYTRNSVRYCCSAGATPDTNRTPQQGDANANTTPAPTVNQQAVPTVPAGCRPDPKHPGDFIAFVKINNSIVLGLSSVKATYYEDKEDPKLLKQVEPEHDRNGVESRNVNYWYYIPQQSPLTKSAFEQDDRFLVDNAVAIEAQLRQAVPGVDFVFLDDKGKLRDIESALNDFDSAQQIVGQSGCPIRVTGGSPTIFVYGKEGTKVTIKPQTNLLYADPPIATTGWKTTIHNNQLVVNGLTRDYLYYEYQPFTFNKPNQGWIVGKNNINGLAATISQALALKPLEEQRLQFEIQNAANNITSDNLFIGLINQSEVNAKLPLNISPQPEKVYRYHFYVGSAFNNQQVTAPQLKTIERKEFMVVEFGSYAAQ